MVQNNLLIEEFDKFVAILYNSGNLVNLRWVVYRSGKYQLVDSLAVAKI